MNIDPMELIQEIERQFPKELTICAQAVQIRKLQEQIPVDESAEE
tara:strand:- start:422 stop:556 length:135 start_codon:yes stop_codon:yes gene_type:complete